MNDGLELVFDNTDLKGDQNTDYDGTAEHGENIIDNLDDRVVKFFLDYAYHLNALLIKTLLPENIENHCCDYY
jgi:hypothetical protein